MYWPTSWQELRCEMQQERDAAQVASDARAHQLHQAHAAALAHTREDADQVRLPSVHAIVPFNPKP